MIHIARWKMILIVLVSVLSILYTIPTFVDQKTEDMLQQHLPSWFPTKSVNLGLDLRGGSHLLLEADVDSVVKQKIEDDMNSLRTDLRKEKIDFQNLTAIPNGLKLELKTEDQASAAKPFVS